MTVDGSLTSAAADVKVTATGGSYTQTGDVSGETGVMVASGATSTIDGNVTSSDGPISVDAGDDIKVTGTAEGKGQVKLTAVNDVSVGGTLTSWEADVKVTATGGRYDQTGDVAGHTGVTTSSGTFTTVIGTLRSTLGKVVMTAATALGIEGSVTGETGVEIASGDATTIEGSVASNAGGVKIVAGDADGSAKAGASISVDGSVTGTGGAVALTAGEDIDVGGTITARDQLKLAAARDVTVDGSLTSAAADVKVTATGGNYTQTGDVSGETGVMVASGATSTIDGNVTSSDGPVSVDAGDDIKVTGNGTSKQRLALTAANDVTVDGDLTSTAADVKVTATGGDYTQTGDVSALTGIVITSGLASKIVGNVDATSGSLWASAGSDFGLDGSAQAITSTIVAARDVTLSVNPLRTTGTQAVTSGRHASIAGSLLSGDRINLTIGGNLNLSGDVKAASAITASSGGNATVDADVASTGGRIRLQAGQKLAVSGSTLTRGQLITMDSGAGALIDGLHRSLGGDIHLTGGDDLTLSPSAAVQSRDGTIILTANGGGNAVGDLTQKKGSGEINARDGRLILRAGNILLENPLIAGSFLLRSTGRIELTELQVKNDIDITGKEIVIAQIIHTGRAGPLLIKATGGNGEMADLVEINAISPIGVRFGVLSTRVAKIHAESEFLEFVTTRIGERGVLSNASFEVLVDNTTKAIQSTGVQLHQVRAGELFYLLLNQRTFSTEVDTLAIDRTMATRVNLPGQPLAIISDDVMTHNGVNLDENLLPLNETEEDLEATMIEAGSKLPQNFVAPFGGQSTTLVGTTVNVCERSITVNLGDFVACQ